MAKFMVDANGQPWCLEHGEEGARMQWVPDDAAWLCPLCGKYKMTQVRRV